MERLLMTFKELENENKQLKVLNDFLKNDMESLLHTKYDLIDNITKLNKENKLLKKIIYVLLASLFVITWLYIIIFVWRNYENIL